MNNKNRESGTMMIEATYCFFMCTVCMMFFLAFGFYLYQKVNVRIVANEIAEDIATSYKYTEETDNSNLTEDDLEGVSFFRYSNVALIGDGEKVRSAKETLADGIIGTRLAGSALAHRIGDADVSLETVKDDVGRYHYKVTVTQQYGFLFQNILKWTGQDPSEKFSATAYSAGVDATTYIYGLKTRQFIANEIAAKSSIAGTFDSITKMIKSIVSTFKSK